MVGGVRWLWAVSVAVAAVGALAWLAEPGEAVVIQNPSGTVRVGIGTDGLIGAQVGAADPGRTFQTSCGGGPSDQQDIGVKYFYNAPGPEHCEFIQTGGYGAKLAISYDSTIGPGEARWENCIFRGTGCKPGGAAAQPPIFTPTFSNCAAPAPASLGSTCDLAFTIGPAASPCLDVTHKYRPSALDNLYEIEVHLEANCPVEDVYYRQVHSLKVGSIGYSADSRSQSLQGLEANPSMLRFAIDNHNVWGSTTENPISRGGLGGSDNDVDCAGGSRPWQGPGRWDEVPFAAFPGAWFTDHSACTQAGAMFDFDLGDFDVGEGRTFYIYYGAGDNEAEALAQLADPGIAADMWGLFQTDNAGVYLPTWTWAYKFLEPTAVIDAIDTPTSPPLFPDLACTGTLVRFDAASLGVAPMVDTWDFGDGTAAAVGGLVTHAYADAGTYTVNLTAKDADGWDDVVTAEVGVVDCDAPDAVLAWSAVGASPHPCAGETVTVQDLSTAGAAPLARSLWILNGVPEARDPYHAAPRVVVPPNPGFLIASLQVWDTNGHTDTATAIVPVCQVICPSVSGFSMSLWAGQPLATALIATDPNGPSLSLGFDVAPPGAVVTVEPQPGLPHRVLAKLAWTPTAADAGVHVVTFTAHDTLCSTTAKLEITVRVRPPRPNPVTDADNDGVGDAADNCAAQPNGAQDDADGDGAGDACAPIQSPLPRLLEPMTGQETDLDLDGVLDGVDNCIHDANFAQTDTDEDRHGDECDPDLDGDGVPQATGADNCPQVPNPRQVDADGNLVGDDCQGAPPRLASLKGAVPRVREAPRNSPAPTAWALAAAGLAATALALHRSRPALVVLFSRLAGPVILAHPVRSALLAAIAAGPGQHVRALSRRLGHAPTTLNHHLRVLERAGHVLLVRHGAYLMCFLAGHPVQEPAAPLAQPVLEQVRQDTGASIRSLARTLGSTPGNVAHHVKRLEAAGLVRVERQGGRNRIFAS